MKCWADNGLNDLSFIWTIQIGRDVINEIEKYLTKQAYTFVAWRGGKVTWLDEQRHSVVVVIEVVVVVVAWRQRERPRLDARQSTTDDVTTPVDRRRRCVDVDVGHVAWWRQRRHDDVITRLGEEHVTPSARWTHTHAPAMRVTQ